MVEPSPSSPFVMAQSKFLLQVLIIALDPPAQLGQIDQAAERDIVGQGREPVFGRLRLVLRPFHEEPFFGTLRVHAFITMGGAHVQSRAVLTKRALRAPLPGPVARCPWPILTADRAGRRSAGWQHGWQSTA